MTAEDRPKRHSKTASRDGEPAVHGSASLRNAKLGRFAELKERVQFWDSELGDYSYVERHSEVIYARIGKFCAIASEVRINALEHPMERVSQHKITYRPNEYFFGAKLDKPFRERRRAKMVEIGHDVWVGHGAIVMPGVRIGHGAVIAAGAVVTGEVPPYAIVAGVPARFLRWRFAPEISERITSLAWWDWDHDRLAKAIADMQALTAAEFVAKYQKE
ncbi:MAG: antibiotic acetyltransferase [Rhizobiales bacterium]|nr:antibiotic acetyltransferase [Hyphomicrobiales bacterium]MBI3672786.1 antibiotic acetyltransferase [Hyphomicrobiales bacterium]